MADVQPAILNATNGTTHTVQKSLHVTPAVFWTLCGHLVVLAVLTALSAFLLYAFYRMERRRNLTAYQSLIRLVITTDLLNNICLMFAFSCMMLSHGPHLTVWCFVQSVTIFLPIYTSLCHILMVCVYRHISLYNIRLPRNATKPTHAYTVASVLIWIGCLLFLVIPKVIWGTREKYTEKCSESHIYTDVPAVRMYQMSLTDVVWIATNVLYGHLYWRIRRQIRSTQRDASTTQPLSEQPNPSNLPPSTQPPSAQPNSSNTAQERSGDMRVASETEKMDRMFASLLIVYNLSMLPVLISMNVTIANDSFAVPLWTKIFTFINTIANPFLCTMGTSALKKEIRAILKRN